MPEIDCRVFAAVGVAVLLVRGVVYPLLKEGVVDVRGVDDSEVSLGALRRPAGRFADAITSSCGDAPVQRRVNVSTKNAVHEYLILKA